MATVFLHTRIKTIDTSFWTNNRVSSSLTSVTDDRSWPTWSKPYGEKYFLTTSFYILMVLISFNWWWWDNSWSKRWSYQNEPKRSQSACCPDQMKTLPPLYCILIKTVHYYAPSIGTFLRNWMTGNALKFTLKIWAIHTYKQTQNDGLYSYINKHFYYWYLFGFCFLMNYWLKVVQHAN